MDEEIEQQNAPNPSDYGDDMSIESLLRRVDEFQKMEELETLDRLEKENATLRHQLLCYQRSCRATMDLFKEAFEAVLLIQTALQTCNEEEEKANRDWLAFWGVHMETPSNLAYQPMEWPKEWI
jgi:hypothetical protein